MFNDYKNKINLKKCEANFKKRLEEEPLEKKDIPALIIAGLIIAIPVLLIAGGIIGLAAWFMIGR